MRKSTRIEQLEAVRTKIINAYVADTIKRGAEDYAPLFRKYKKYFEMLVISEMRTDKAMRKYFRELYSGILDNINWSEFERRKASATRGAFLKAGILDYLVKAFWEEQTLVLKIFLTGTLMDAIEAGGLYTEEDLNVDVAWSRNEAPVIEFLNKHTLTLSKGLTVTTQDRIVSALKLSIDNGEDRDGAVKRINSVINDTKRATTIAQTESVRAFNEGRHQVGKEVGADRKRWRTAGAKDFCLNFQGEGIVLMDHMYLTPRGVKVLIPPGHPNCRCGHEIFMPEEKV